MSEMPYRFGSSKALSWRSAKGVFGNWLQLQLIDEVWHYQMHYRPWRRYSVLAVQDLGRRLEYFSQK
jgi:hypothetical protein